MSQLKDLQILNLSKNDFSKGLPEVICQLTALQDLNLGGCKLSSLPDRFVLA